MRVKVFGVLATVATAVALAAVTVADLNAQEPRRAHRGALASLQSDIGLTDQQVAEIRGIYSEGRKAGIRRNADLRIARLELEELLAAATVDEAAIAARVKTIGELQSAAFKERTASRLAVRKLVSAEQYQKMQQMKRHAVRAHRTQRARPMRGERGPSGPDGGEDLPEVDPS